MKASDVVQWVKSEILQYPVAAAFLAGCLLGYLAKGHF